MGRPSPFLVRKAKNILLATLFQIPCHKQYQHGKPGNLLDEMTIISALHSAHLFCAMKIMQGCQSEVVLACVIKAKFCVLD
jgi:hypothetical protein